MAKVLTAVSKTFAPQAWQVRPLESCEQASLRIMASRNANLGAPNGWTSSAGYGLHIAHFMNYYTDFCPCPVSFLRVCRFAHSTLLGGSGRRTPKGSLSLPPFLSLPALIPLSLAISLSLPPSIPAWFLVLFKHVRRY